MKKTMRQWWAAVVVALGCMGMALGADIQYVADNGGGEYCGVGYGISVSVSAPGSGYAIKYAESSTGPWQNTPVTYTDVCSAKPVYFQVSADGYTTVVDSRTVTITPKALTSDYVWLVLPPEDYVYDGTEKTPDVACGDGNPSIITTDDFDVSFTANVNAGTATATFTGKRNYAGDVTEDFEILKADNGWKVEPTMPGWTYGQAASEPSSVASNGTAVVTYRDGEGAAATSKPSLPGDYTATFTVAESQNYNELTKDVPFTISPATINFVADNVSGEYNGSDYGIDATISVSAPASGAVVRYSTAETGPWQSDPILYTNACAAVPIFFEISATGYTTITNSRTVTITPKALTADYVWLVLPTEDYVYDGNAKVPDVACGDGNPSIITTDDFDVAFDDNVNAGTVTATFTGKRNYAGDVTEDFEILKADNGWITEPSMPGWTYGQAASEPTSVASNGTAVVTYRDGEGAAATSKPSLPGDYTATFTVAESQNYKELTKDVPFTISPATINFVADNVSGEYNGSGYGIDATISVSAPASGAVVRYSTAETGPWQSDPILYTNACAAAPIFFEISATGYTTITNSRTVTITPKALTSDYVWLVLPTEDYVYDGNAKVPDVACGDGNPSIITTEDFEVSFDDNVNAGTVTATFTGKRNYVGTATEEFEIKKGTLNGGEEPGGGTVPTGGLSKFDVTAEYDGTAHTVDEDAILSAWQGVNADVVVEYALSDDVTDWNAAPETFVDVCETSIWYKVSLANYNDFIHEVKITITPRSIVNAMIAAIEDVTYADVPVEPVPTVTDGDPSIITSDDYDVSYSGNNEPGQATLTLTGKRNYAGTTNVNFTILAPAVTAAGLAADIAWKHLKATGTYFAQLRVTCTNGLAAGVSDLKFMFADRMGTDGTLEAALWNSQSRGANQNTTTHGGESYRYVALDPSLITAENVPVTFGISNASASTIPVADRTIEMYVHRRVVPQTGNEGAAKVGDFVGYVGWKSGGGTFAIPVVAGGSSLHASLHAMQTLSAPLSRQLLNTALAVGVPMSPDSNPYCRLTEFSTSGEMLSGKVEVGAEIKGREQKGALGENAVVTLLGAKSPAGPFSEVAAVSVSEDGSFSLAKPADVAFFKLRIDIVEIAE